MTASGSPSEQRPKVSMHSQDQAAATSSENTKLTLETLAPNVLESIFSHLHTPEWRILCTVSRDLYWPAINHLYRQVLITSRKAKHIKEEVNNWPSNKCTVTGKLLRFLSMVKTYKHLAAKIQSVIVHEAQDTLWIPMILAHTNLQALHYIDHHVCSEIPNAGKTQNMSTITCYVRHYPAMSSCLTRLKLSHLSNDADRPWFRKLAKEMIQTGAYVNIKSLVFDCLKANDFKAPFHLFVSPLWVDFFVVFAEHKVKLQLESLGLDGGMRIMCQMKAALVNFVADLKALRVLELRLTEDTHPRLYHEDANKPNFLEAITEFTSLIDTLGISYTNTCSQCTVENVERTLREKVPKQLKELWIENRFFFGEPFPIQNAILKHQRNLVKLRYETEKWIYSEFKGLAPGIELLKNYSRKDIGNAHLRRLYTPRMFVFEEPLLHASEKKVKLFKKRIRTISRIVADDPILKGAAKNLPHLTDYHAYGFDINMKEERGVVVNGETIPFDFAT